MKSIQVFAEVVLFLTICVWIRHTTASSCPIKSTASINIDKPLNKLWISSPYPFYVSQAPKLQVTFYGTTGGKVASTVNGNEATLTLSVSKDQISKASSSLSPLIQLLVSVMLCGAIYFRWPTNGATMVVAIALGLSSFNLIESAIQQTSCSATTANIQIPFGQVNFVCDSTNTTSCQCGPGFYGTNCDLQGCQATEEQLARRRNYTAPYPPIEMNLPEPGESYCDSNFGTQVWRITNRVPLPESVLPYVGSQDDVNDNRISIFGYVGFSPGNKYFLAETRYVGILYEINIDSDNVPHINTQNRTFVGPIVNSTGSQIPMDIGSGVWMTETRFAFLYGYKLYSVDVSENPPNNQWTGTFLGTLEPFLQNSYYNADLGVHRCSSSRRRQDGSVVMHCDIAMPVGDLKAPDYKQLDSHPNATCINAAQYAGASSGVGHIVFRITSATPADPSTNIELIHRFLNGLDSDDWYCFETLTQHSDAVGTRRWVLYNPYNNGYKATMDRSGEWINQAGVIDQPDTLKFSAGTQPNAKIKVAAGQGIVSSVVNDYEGHGGIGWASSLVVVDGAAPCLLCLAYWDFETIPDEDPRDVTPLFVGYNFDDGPWVYQHGVYGTYFHSTATNRAEGIVQTGCDAKNWDCDIIPRGAEVLRVLPFGSGTNYGGVIERLVSTRNTANTLYNVITSECDDTGPCWAAFESTWGEIRPDPEATMDSDIFIFRFR